MQRGGGGWCISHNLASVHFSAFLCIMFWSIFAQYSYVFCVSWTNLSSKMHLHKYQPDT